MQPLKVTGATWPTVNPGTLRHWVSLQVGTTTADSFGQIRKTWSTVHSDWAGITALRMYEQIQNDIRTGIVTHEIILRFPVGVDVQVGMRVLYKTHAYLIQSPDNLEGRDILLRLQCRELNGIE